MSGASFPFALDFEIVKEAVFYRAYKLLSVDLKRALSMLELHEFELLKEHGLSHTNWQKLLNHAGDKNRIRLLRGYFTALQQRDPKEIDESFVKLLKMATVIMARNEATGFKFTRQYFELPWTHGRAPLAEDNMFFADLVK